MRTLRTMRYALLVLVLLASVSSFAGVFVSVSFGPPALPVYEQPPCPEPNYIWVPGYWAYGPAGYFWVPGTWVLAPQPGLLWTPGYWGWNNGFYIWHAGYWGPVVGFYGGVNYGYGYYGDGYHGGYWRGRNFYYNRTVNNVNVTHITNVYNTTVINNNRTVNRVSYNGGPGGLTTRPTANEERVARMKHFEPTRMQNRQVETARNNRDLLASVNRGRPAIAATPKANVFKGRDVVEAREAGAPYKPANREVAQPRANNSVPRPGNNVARPNSNNNVVRPGNDTAGGNNIPRPNNNVAKPGVIERNAGPVRGSVPRPPNTVNRENNARVENTPRPAMAPRPDTRTETEPRMDARKPASVPRPESMPRAQAPKPNSAPRTEAPRAYSAPRPQNSQRYEPTSRVESGSRANAHNSPEPHGDNRAEGRRPQ